MDAPAERGLADRLVTEATAFLSGGTNLPAPRPRWLRWRGLDLVEIADVIVALICFLVADAWLRSTIAHHHHAYSSWTLVLIALVSSAPLVLRTRHPLAAWGASALAMAAIGIPDVFPLHFLTGHAYIPAALLVYGLCLYAVTVRCAQRIVVATALVTVAGALVIEPGAVFAAIFLAAIPLLLGAVVRTRRSGKRRLAEQERRHSGERALLEERQRIARELHDVVAHHMSVIAIAAEAAPYKTADPAPELVESFGEIRRSALTGLTEMRRLLGVLRTGEPTTTPQPGLGGLDALLDSARSGGVSAAASITGTPVPLPEGVDLSAYRILQEALSNVMRHAPASRVDVRVSYLPGSLELDIRNDAGPENSLPDGTRTVAAQADPGGGQGIIGMRERAAMLGGTLFAGPSDGGFRVHAFLPIDTDVPIDTEDPA